MRLAYSIALICGALFASACGSSAGGSSPGPGAGGGGGGVVISSGGAGGTINVTSSASVAGTGGGGGSAPCDTIDECGDLGKGCVYCAVSSTCAPQFEACIDDPGCKDYSDCLKACPENDTACVEGCKQTFPEAPSIYEALLSCVLCQECVVPCGTPSSECPK
jgi:hypothetical protein